MRRTLRSLLVIGVVLVCTGVLFAQGKQADRDKEGKRTIKVMTYNVDEGTDFVEALGAQTFDQFLAAVELTLNNVIASNPPLRMKGIAHQIAETQPDLVGLQEVTTWRVGPGPNPTHIQFDMLQELLDALEDQGQHYVPVVVVHDFILQAPLPDLTTFVEAMDSDVILARSEKHRDQDGLRLSNVQTQSFQTLLTLPTLIGSLTSIRGWGSVDVTFHHESFRFIVTHLENVIPQAPVTALIQQAQAAELILGPANTLMPVIIAGDFNADAANPNDPTFATYQEMINSGFGDAWTATHHRDPGFTWGQTPGDRNPISTLTQRIDFVFFHGEIRALNSKLAGAEPHDRIHGFWPSDHAGVGATLQVGKD
jgi:endonuclease/exonuclease/phosphatase family metal-dependent hydrolase